jgi:hypothetical protein
MKQVVNNVRECMNLQMEHTSQMRHLDGRPPRSPATRRATQPARAGRIAQIRLKSVYFSFAGSQIGVRCCWASLLPHRRWFHPALSLAEGRRVSIPASPARGRAGLELALGTCAWNLHLELASDLTLLFA